MVVSRVQLSNRPTDIIQKKMNQTNSMNSKPYILNQYDLVQGSMKLPDTFVQPQTVLFLLKENNDRIIWLKSVLVFSLEPVGAAFSAGQHCVCIS